MMKSLFFLLSFVSSFNVWGQQPITEGKIHYKQLLGGDPKMDKLLNRKKETYLFFKNETAAFITETKKFLRNGSMGISLIGDVYDNNRKARGVLLSDSYNFKRGMEYTIDSLREPNIFSINHPSAIDITYQDSTKEIAGYICHKAVVKTTYRHIQTAKIVELLREVYFNPLISNVFPQFKGLKGMPLEYKTSQDSSIVHYVATKLEDRSISEKELDIKLAYPDIIFKQIATIEGSLTIFVESGRNG
jgi:GLPGLI family protein